MFRGLSSFPITPADEAGRIDAPALRRLVARLVEQGTDSIGLLGSTGTFPFWSRSERRRAVATARAETGGRVPLLVGVGALRTDEAVALAQDARQAGADAGLLAAVSYTPLTDDEVFQHFETVARESGFPICVYNNPVTTHFTISDALLGRLSRVPGIVAVKNPAPEGGETEARHAATRGLVPPAFSVGYSGDWRAAGALLAGGEAWYSVVGGLFPRPCRDLIAAVQRGDTAEAKRLDLALEPLWQIFRTHSSLRVMYAAANLLGLTDAQPPRPILPLSKAARQEVDVVIDGLALGR